MNKQYCNIIKIYLVSQVERIENGEVLPKQNQQPIIAYSDDFNITPATSDSKASLLTSATTTLFIEKLSEKDANTLKYKRSVIIQAHVGVTPRVIGSVRFPATVTFTETLNCDIIKIEHKYPSGAS